MPPPTTVTATSLQEYVGCIEAFPVNDHPCWFRGVGKSSYKLLPGLLRPDDGRELPELFANEREMFRQFQLRSLPYLPSGAQSEWELLFTMQHHRMPTRLLDWTENILVALYFALEDADRHGNTEDAAVWCLDPIGWNDHTLREANPPNDVLTPADRRIVPYGSPPDLDLLREPPIAIYAPHNSARIVAQSGTFMVFGNSLLTMQELYEQDDYPDSFLRQVIIPAGDCSSVFQSLLRAGYTHSRIFPDLDGLAAQLRRSAGFPT